MGTKRMRSIEPEGEIDYTGGMIAIKEEKMDTHSVTQAMSGTRLSGVYNSDPRASKEDSSL